MSPRVSVVIPCFNLGAFLQEAVDSVLAQTFEDVEIVVVDDGSTDPQTTRMLSGWRGPKSRVVRTENRGLPAARNTGVRATKGEYVCCLDADDRLRPAWLEVAVRTLDAAPDVAFVSHWLHAFGDEEWDWKPGRCDLPMLLDVNTVNGAALVRRRVIEELGGFDESMREGCEDWEFWIRAAEAGYRGAIVPEILYDYRQRPGSMSRDMNSGDVHLRLYGELVDKHPDSYRAHLSDLVLRREYTAGVLRRSIASLEEEIRAELEPALAERRLERDRGRARLSDIERTRAQFDALRGQLDAVHRSWSWRVTSPLRHALTALKKLTSFP